MSDGSLDNAPRPTSAGRKFRIKCRSGDVRLDAVQWEAAPDYWIASLKDAIKSITYSWITEVYGLLSSYNSGTTPQQRAYIDRNYQQLEYGIRDLWGCWKTFDERTPTKVSHIDLTNSPIYSELSVYHSSMMSLPNITGCDTPKSLYKKAWETRMNCRDICLSLRRVRGCVEEVVMRVIDRQNNESREWELTDEEIWCLPQVPPHVNLSAILSDEILELLGELPPVDHTLDPDIWSHSSPQPLITDSGIDDLGSSSEWPELLGTGL